MSKERPILFSGPMVRALLDGSKTQTRRVVRKQFGVETVPVEMCAETDEGWQTTGHSGRWWDDVGGLAEDAISCPFGVPGDRLWVRESGVISKLRGTLEKPGLFRHDVPTTPTTGDYWVEETRAPGASYNVAGCPRSSALLSYGAKACPSIHMPRWASRITLEVTGVRVERLQDISDRDCIAEGIGLNPSAEGVPMTAPEGETMPRAAYRALWDSLAAHGADWQANPWVWVVEFKRVK